MWNSVACSVALAAVLSLPALAVADVAPACQQLQQCVTTSLGTDVAGCAAQNSACGAANQDRFALSAGVLATRAISVVHCDTHTFTTKAACARCYRKAARPLKLRLDLQLFHGLLAYTAALVQTQQTKACGSLP